MCPTQILPEAYYKQYTKKILIAFLTFRYYYYKLEQGRLLRYNISIFPSLTVEEYKRGDKR